MEILVNGSTIISRTGSCQSQMKRTRVNLDQYRGQTAKVKLIDYGTGHWGHITFDDLRHGVPCESNHFLFTVIWYLLCSHNVMAKLVSIITVFSNRVRKMGQVLKDVSIKGSGKEITRIIFVIIKKHFISILSIINRNLTIATVVVRLIHVGLGIQVSSVNANSPSLSHLKEQGQHRLKRLTHATGEV